MADAEEKAEVFENEEKMIIRCQNCDCLLWVISDTTKDEGDKDVIRDFKEKYNIAEGISVKEMFAKVFDILGGISPACTDCLNQFGVELDQRFSELKHVQDACNVKLKELQDLENYKNNDYKTRIENDKEPFNERDLKEGLKCRLKKFSSDLDSLEGEYYINYIYD